MHDRSRLTFGATLSSLLIVGSFLLLGSTITGIQILGCVLQQPCFAFCLFG